MTTQTRVKFSAILGTSTFLACLMVGSDSRGTVIPLSGGNPGQGYAPLVNEVYAFNLGIGNDGSGGASPNPLPVPTEVVQGVTFVGASSIVTGAGVATLPGYVTQTGFSAYNFGLGTGPNYGAGANQTSLSTMLSNMFYTNDGNDGSLVLGGLIPGRAYQIDVLANSTGFGDRSGTLAFVGATSPTPDNFSESNGGPAIDIRETLAADTFGKITLSITNGSGTYPAIAAFSVTTTPEPSSIVLALVGLAGLGAWRLRRALRSTDRR